jgi:glycosyltransferase involved in cell wall biosynthesis
MAKNKALNITIVTTSYPSIPYPTSGLFVEQLANELSKSHHVLVVTPASNNKKSFPKDINTFRYAPKKYQILAHQPGGIPVALSHSWINWLLLIPFMSCLTQSTLSAAKNSDIVFANWSITGIICGIAAKIRSKPCVTAFRGEDIKRLSQSTLIRLMIRICIRVNDKIVCVSSDMKDKVVQEFPAYSDKVVHIPNGVRNTFLDIKRSKQTLGDCIRILCVGNLIPRKDFITVVRAIAVSKHVKRLRLDIAGEGIERHKLEKEISKLGLVEHINLLGVQKHEEVEVLLSRADLFVISSLSEGRPNVLIEAMASELPIVGSNIDGVTEILNHNTNGTLFQAGDHIELARMLDKLIEDNELRLRIANEARRTIIKSELTWATCAEQYSHIFTSLVEI